MFEISEETKIDYHRLTELRKQREAGSKKLEKLSDELRLALSAAEEKTLQLKSLRKAYAVAEREIKDFQNEIFSLNKQCSDITESSVLLEGEFEKREKQLIGLEGEKKRKTGRITELLEECKSLPDTLVNLENELKELSAKKDERTGVKQKLSDDIAQALSKTSVDRDAVEALMMDLNNTFLDTIDRKNEAQTRLSETETSIATLTETIRHLEQQVVAFEEIKTLQNQRVSVTAELNKKKETLATIDSEYKDTNRRLQDTKDHLDSVISKNEDLLTEIVSMERKVSEYDELLTLRAIAQRELDEGSEENQRRLDDLLETFTYSVKLNEAILLTQENVKKLGGIV